MSAVDKREISPPIAYTGIRFRRAHTRLNVENPINKKESAYLNRASRTQEELLPIKDGPLQ